MAGDAVLDVRIAGEGPTLVLLPALGRSASDLNKFACHLVAAGYRVVLPEPRGIGASSGRLDGLTLYDLARDVAAVVEAMCAEPAVLIGQLTIR
jgi:pimeloyl-ACP methyl ester carboxylesterase